MCVCVCARDCLVLVVGIRRKGSLGRIGGRRLREIKVQLHSFSSLFGPSGVFFVSFFRVLLRDLMMSAAN